MKVETKITFDWDDLQRLVVEEMARTMHVQIRPDQLEIKEDENGKPYIIINQREG